MTIFAYSIVILGLFSASASVMRLVDRLERPRRRRTAA